MGGTPLAVNSSQETAAAKSKKEDGRLAKLQPLIRKQMNLGEGAVGKKKWGEASKAAAKILEMDPDHAAAQELKHRASWGPLPEKTSGNLKYKVHPISQACAITDVIDKKKMVASFVLPGKIEGRAVVRIGQHAFSRSKGLKSVTIPSSVTSIGEGAFMLCWNLANLSVATGNPSYQADDGVLFTKGGKTLVQYPIEKPGKSYTIPPSVTSIGNRAFWGSKFLTSMTIPSGVTSIGNRAFEQCSLKSVTIPSSVTSIGEEAFYDCTSLKSVTILSGVTSIGNMAFLNCCSLTSLTIPSSVTSIGYYAFYRCKGLTSVTIPSSVTSIGDQAFFFCKGLASVTIQSGVTSIGDGAFYGCSGLKSVTIPSSVTSIGN
jgi:hypothetical protein